MASPRRIVHLPFKDPDGNNDGHVLVRVSPKKPSSTSSSPSPLDLELLATQGREAFVTKCQFGSFFSSTFPTLVV